MNRKPNILLALIITVLMVYFAGVVRFHWRRVQFHGVLSGPAMKCAEQAPTGWTGIQFDDSGWEPVQAPYWDGYEIPFMKEIQVDPMALPVWHRSRAATVWFRKTFTLTRLPTRPVTLNILVDDDYELYINGRMAASNMDHTSTRISDTVAAGQFLVEGTNVIAVKGVNRGLSGHLILYMPLEDAEGRFDTPYGLLLRYSLLLLALALLLAWNLTGFPGIPNLRTALPSWTGWLIVPGWAAWVTAFRTYPVYIMIPYQVTSRFLPGRTAVMLATGALLWLLTLLWLNRMHDTAPHTQDSAGMPGAPRAELSTRTLVILALLIIISATALRLAKYDSVPPGIFQDDASFMLEGEHLLKNHRLTVWSDAMNGNATLMLYWDGLVQLITGKNTLALRMAPAIPGILTVVIIPYLFRGMFPRSLILIFMGFLAVSHYHINYSRIPWDQVTVPLLALIALPGLVRGLTAEKYRLAMVIAGISAALGLYGYAGYRVVPGLAAGIVLYNWDSIRAYLRRNGWLWHAGPAIAVLTPLALYLMDHKEKFLQRTGLVDIFPTFLMYHDPVPLAVQTVKTLMMSVFVGDGVTPRHNTVGAPALDVLSGTFFMIGLVLVLGRSDRLARLILPAMRQAAPLLRGTLVWWLAAGAVVSSLTFECPHFSRSINLLIPFILIAALGAAGLIQSQRRSWLIVPVILALLAGTGILNAKIYFVDKLKDPNVYEHCGYLGKVFNQRVDELQTQHGAELRIAQGPQMYYLSDRPTFWLNPEIHTQTGAHVSSSSAVRYLLSRNPGKPIHLFLRPDDQFIAAEFADSVTEQITVTSPNGKVQYVEYVLRPRVEKADLSLVSGVQLQGLEPGLVVDWFDNPDWNGEPVASRVESQIGFRCEAEETKPMPSPFSMRWHGFIRIQQQGIYRFILTSDDGSYLTIHGRLVVDNGGEHGLQTVGGTIHLGEGYHPVELQYFDSKWLAALDWSWQTPGDISVQPVPPDILFHTPPAEPGQ